MFKSLTIERYRGIEKLHIDDLKRVNLFVGENNSGKTSVLEAFYLNMHAVDARVAAGINSLRQMFKFIPDRWELFFHNMTVKKPIAIHSEFDGQERLLKISLREIRDEGDFSIDLSMSEKKVVEPGKYVGWNFDFSLKEPQTEWMTFHSHLKDTVLKSNQIQMNYKVDTKGSPYFVQGSFIGSSNPINDALLLQWVKEQQINKKISKIIPILNNIDPKIQTIIADADGIIRVDIGLGSLVPLNVVGAGTARVLFILLAISNLQGSILLIDEIENGLHPNSQRVLWEAIFRAAKEFNVQVFATTHSQDCLNAVTEVYQKLDKEDFFKEESDVFRMFRVSNRDNVHQVVKYTEERLKSSLEGGWEVR